MKKYNVIDKIQTAVAVINKDMIVVEANKSYQKRFDLDLKEIINKKCFKSAYLFEYQCDSKEAGSCPVMKSFKTKQVSTAIRHNWIDDHAIVEEVTSSPILDAKGDVDYVVEEFRDVTALLGLHKGIITICSYCRKLRDEDGQWVSFEAYFHKHTGAKFSHGICENCNDTLITNSDGERTHSHK